MARRTDRRDLLFSPRVIVEASGPSELEAFFMFWLFCLEHSGLFF